MKLKGKTKSFVSYFILLIGIIFIFILCHLTMNANNIYIDLLGSRAKASNNILIKENGEYYLSYKYIEENIDSEIYFDSVSRKVVISSDKGLFKIRINDKKVNVNFEEEAINNKGVIEKKDKYISLEIVDRAYNVDKSVNNNTIYLYNENYYDGKIKYNNVGLYKSSNMKSEIVDYVDKKDKIKVICEDDDFILVKVNNEKVGYLLKNAVKYTIKNNQEEEGMQKKKIYMFADENSKTIQKNLPITGVIVDMFEVSQTSVNLNYKNISGSFFSEISNNGYKLYAKIGNGYNLAGFSTTTMSQILSDESKRINLINNINEKIKEYDLDGIVLDFKKLKEKDISNYIQFIKELKSFSNKKVIVNIDASEYKIYSQVANYTDFSIVNAYNQRDLKATVAGSVSEISWMKNIIEDCLTTIDREKLVIGLPAYSILWTEKNSNVIDSEIYNLKAVQNYIEKNKLELKKVNGQNYSELKKGSLIYRMWLEDEFSIKNRLDIIKENKLNGIAIYKLGYENDVLINTLKNNYY